MRVHIKHGAPGKLGDNPQNYTHCSHDQRKIGCKFHDWTSRLVVEFSHLPMSYFTITKSAQKVKVFFELLVIFLAFFDR